MKTRTFFPVFLLALAVTSAPVSAFQKKIPDIKNPESWTELSLAGSVFPSIPPLIGQIDSQPSFTRHLIRLQWRASDPIDTFLVIPKPVEAAAKSAAKPPVILYLYNYTTNTDRFMRVDICRGFTAGGVAAVGFPLALSAQRFHERGAMEWFVSDLQEALVTSAHDIQEMIDYLQTRPEVDSSRIGIFAEGSSAAVAILAASVDPRIKVLDLEDAWGDWPEWLAESTIIPPAERASYLTPAFLKTVENLDPVQVLPKLKIPVRIQYSKPKSAVPPEVRKRMEAALPAQAAHTPVEPNFNWIKKQLTEITVSANPAAAVSPR
jgi:hypothetical protein